MAGQESVGNLVTNIVDTIAKSARGTSKEVQVR